MPLSITSPQSPGPIDVSTTIRITPNDPDGSLDTSEVIVQFDDGTTEDAVRDSATSPSYTVVPDGGDFLITRNAGWLRSFTLMLIGVSTPQFQRASLRFNVKAGIQDDPIARLIEDVETKVEAITPTYDTAVSFERVSGDLSIYDEPPIGRRRFEVDLTGQPERLPFISGRLMMRCRLEVQIRYDALNDMQALVRTMAADDAAIIAQLERPPFASGTHLVSHIGSRNEVAQDEDERQFPVHILTFQADYLITANPG